MTSRAIAIPLASSGPRIVDVDRADLAELWDVAEDQAHADAIEAGRWVLMRRANRDASAAVAILRRRADAAEDALARAVDDAIAARAELGDAVAFAARAASRLARIDRAAVRRALGAWA